MSLWQFRKSNGDHPPAHWANELAITPLLLELLWLRGFRSRQSMDLFLKARLAQLTHPDHWPNIPEAANLLATSLLQGKQLAIWGDYDVDGITATAVALDVLEEHGFRPFHHLPDRRSEGYGINIEGIETLAANGCEILLTVDCGINDVAAIKRARDLGMTVIVTDHHLPAEILPEANIIVDPRMDGEWPCTHLAGVGVSFYLMAAVNLLLAPHTKRRYKMDNALDLVGLGTLADVMPLEGENRILVRGGLSLMSRSSRPGICALKEVSGFDIAGDVNSGQAVYRLAPRINAAGRMGHPELALQLLRADGYIEATRLARELDEKNQERQTEERRIFQEASQQAEDMLSKQNYAGLVLQGDNWHPGIVGIVASRIVEKFNRPAVILYRDGEFFKGSGRSIEDFDLHGGLARIANCLEGFGGHKLAAGVRVRASRLEEFRNAFHQSVKDCLGETPRESTLLLEGELRFEDASNHTFLRELELMQPFGPGNPEPVFASPPVIVKRRSPLGKSQEHILLEVKEPESNITLYAKGWRMANSIPPEITGQRIRIAFTTGLDVYNGQPRIGITMRDWKYAD